MILREVGGLQNKPTSSFSELSHLKALICKKKARLLWLPTPYKPNHGAPFTRPLSQGDFCVFEKVCEGKPQPANNAIIPIVSQIYKLNIL